MHQNKQRQTWITEMSQHQWYRRSTILAPACKVWWQAWNISHKIPTHLMTTHYTSYSLANAFHSKETIKKQHIIQPQTRHVSAMDRDYVGQLCIREWTPGTMWIPGFRTKLDINQEWVNSTSQSPITLIQHWIIYATFYLACHLLWKPTSQSLYMNQKCETQSHNSVTLQAQYTIPYTNSKPT
jgi:hypothetical protein